MNPQDGEYRWYRHESDNRESLASNRVSRILQLDGNTLLISSRANYDVTGDLISKGGLNALDLSTGEIKVVRPWITNDSKVLEDELTAMALDDQGKVWIGSLSGSLFHLDLPSNEARYFEDPDPRATEVSDIMLDRSGILWVARAHGRVSMANARSSFLGGWTNDSGNPGSLSEGRVSSILDDSEGVLWVGMRNTGLNRFNVETSSFQRFFQGDHVSAMAEDSLGRLWVGTYDRGLVNLDRETHAIQRVLARDRLGTQYMRIRALLEDSKGRLWVSHLHGLDRVDLENGRTTRLDIVDCVGRKITEASNGELWWGTQKGVAIIDPESMDFQLIEDQEGYGGGLRDSATRFLFEDSRGDVWVGTNRGLNRFDRLEERFYQYDAVSGMTTSRVEGALEDSTGAVWLSSQAGIFRFNPLTATFLRYDQSFGFINESYESAASFKGRDGTMYFGGKDGLDVFRPFDVSRDLRRPTIVIESVRGIDGKQFDWNVAGVRKRLEVPSSENYLSFEFAMLDFADRGANHYQYRMQGFNDEWVDAGSRRTASFTNLPPGEYKFQVRGSNSRGSWNLEGSEVGLAITPMYWQTDWFKMAVLAAIVFVALSVHYYTTLRIRKVNTDLTLANAEVEKANERLESAAKESQKLAQESDRLARKAEAANIAKSQFLANMSHEIRTPLNGVVGMLSLMRMSNLGEKEREYCDIADGSAHALLGLLNDILDVSTIEAGELTIEKAPFDLRETIKDAFELNRLSAEEKGLAFSLKLPTLLCGRLIGDAGRIRQIVINYLSNAIKFTERGSILTRVSSREDEDGLVGIRIEVTDTGIGIKEEDQDSVFNAFSQVDSSNTREHGGAGLGLSICRELVSIMGGDIGMMSESGVGSSFWFELKLPKERNDEGSPEKEESLDSAEDPAVEAKERSSQRVLVVEDNDVNQRVAIAILNRLGCEAVPAVDGEECLEIYRPGGFDMIFMDCQMPGIDGYETTRRLRELEPAGERTPIIALTARAMQGDRELCLKAGMDDYIPKPVSPDEIERVLRKWGIGAKS